MSRSGFLITAAAFLALIGLVAWFTLRDVGTEGVTDDGDAVTEGTVKTSAPVPEKIRDAPDEPPVEAGPAPVAVEIPSAVTGVVLDPEGRPRPGAEVYAAPADAAAVLRADATTLVRTDDKGAFRLLLPPGRADVIAWAPGCRPGIVEDLAVPSGGEIEAGTIRLTAGLAIRGRVVDTGGGRVAEARVVAWREDGLKSLALLPARLGIPAWGGTAETDEKGEFAVTGLAAGRFQLAADGLGIEMKGDPVEAGAGDTEVVLVVRRIRIATGRVVSEVGDAPVSEATVTLTVQTPKWRQSFMYRTLPDGRFAFDLSDDRFSVDGVSLALRVTAKGFEDGAWDALELAAAAPEAKLLLRVVPAVPVEPGRLKGRMVYDTGAPFANCQLTLSFSKAEGGASVHRVGTDENGAFLLTEVPAGEYTLSTAPGNSTLLRETGKRLVIPPGGEEYTELTMVRGGDVQLEIRNARGEAADGAVVHVLDEEGKDLYSVPASEGVAVVGDLPAGTAKFRVTAPGHAPKTVSVEVVKDQRTRTLVTLEEAR